MKEAENTDLPIQHLNEIRSMMERSSRFISLSGFSGVFAGLFALAGEYIVISHFRLGWVNDSFYDFQHSTPTVHEFIFFLTVASVVLILSLGTAVILTMRRAGKAGLKSWDSQAKRLLVNLMIPLAAGGIFCLAMAWQHLYGLIMPATLIFYGIALFNGSRYTLNDIRALGIIEIALGLFTCFLLQYTLVAWAIGFGVMHIIYGIVMYYKYER